jgi:hypothetical protein
MSPDELRGEHDSSAVKPDAERVNNHSPIGDDDPWPFSNGGDESIRTAMKRLVTKRLSHSLPSKKWTELRA